MIFIQIFMTLVFVLSCIALCVLVIDKSAEWVASKFGDGVDATYHAITYFSFVISLFCFLLENTK